MKVVAISVEWTFTNYTEFSRALQEIEKDPDFSEFVCSPNKLTSQYKNEFRSPMQFFEIDWSDVENATNIKTNKFGKPYNGDAPAKAAAKIVDYATHYIVFGKGDYHTNRLAREAGLEEVKTGGRQSLEKKYSV